MFFIMSNASYAISISFYNYKKKMSECYHINVANVVLARDSPTQMPHKSLGKSDLRAITLQLSYWH